MILYLNDKSEIHDVNSTEDLSLTPVYVDENNEKFPFKGMSNEGICCFMVTVSDGVITMKTPYVDSQVVPHIDQLGKHVQTVTPWTETQSASMGDSVIEFTDVPEGPVTVIIKDSEGRYHPGSIVINGSIVIVSFEPLEYAADITLKVG